MPYLAECVTEIMNLLTCAIFPDKLKIAHMFGTNSLNSVDVPLKK